MMPPDDRFLSAAQCRALLQRAAAVAVGGGNTSLRLESSWTAHMRWARNRVASSGDVRNTTAEIVREIRGLAGAVQLNLPDEAALDAAVHRAERLLQLTPALMTQPQETDSEELTAEYAEPYLKPTIWSDATYTQTPEERAGVVQGLLAEVERAGLMAAGYLAVGASGVALLDTKGLALYYPFTTAEYSVTVRDPKGTSSGWAGGNHWDWTRIDAAAITRRAVEKCLTWQHPVLIEPARYTTILEPQAAYQVIGWMVGGNSSGDWNLPPDSPFGRGGKPRFGEVVMDERLTLDVDPMDPDLASVPFAYNGVQGRLEAYHAAVWVSHGVLVNLPYSLEYAMRTLGRNTGLLTSGALRIRSSETVSMEEMIATTPFGLLVTCFDGDSMSVPHSPANGATRDGVWLIEGGRITKSVKNLFYEENPSSLLQSSRLAQVGPSVKVFNPPYAPAVVPPLKIRDFNFTKLADAI